MPTPEEIVVTTLFTQSDNIADQILYNDPVTAILADAGRVKRKAGGYELRYPLMYNTTAVGGFYSGAEAFNLDMTDDATAMVFAIKQAYEPVSITGREKRANRDTEQLIDLLDLKIQAAINRLKNTWSTSLRGDGTGFGGKALDGIVKAVSTTPTSGSYGGHTRSTNSFAQNQAVTISGGFTAANVQAELTDMMMRVTRGSESPDVGLLGRDVWKALHSSLTAIQRITKSDNKALAGFKTLQFDGIDFVHDGGYGGAVTSVSQARLLNSKYWELALIRDADFKPVDKNKEMIRPVDQDAWFTTILAEGNLCCSAPQLQIVGS